MVAQGSVRFSQHTSVSFSHSTVQSEFSQYEVDRTFSQFSQGSVSSVTVIGKPNETNSSVSSVSSVSLNFSQFSLWVPDHGLDVLNQQWWIEGLAQAWVCLPYVPTCKSSHNHNNIKNSPFAGVDDPRGNPRRPRARRRMFPT